MQTTIKVKGLKDVERALAQLDKHTTRRTVGRNALKRGGQRIADAASRLAPDDPATAPPDLKTLIKVGTKLSKSQRRRRAKAADVEVFVGVADRGRYYGHIQEFGTVNLPAQPFMRPAWYSERKRVLVTIRQELWAQVAKAAARQAKRKAKGK